MTPIQAEFPTTPTSQGESATFFKRVRALLVLGMVVIGLLVASPSVLAARVHVFGSTFAKEGSGAGQLKEPSGVAVNEVALGFTGDVYVTDSGNDRVERFSAGGEGFLGEFDGTATPAGSFSAPSAVAVDNSPDPLDPSAGDVYVLDSGHDVVDKFTAEGVYLGQISKQANGTLFGEVDGLAVDREGKLWVYHASGAISSYSNAVTNAPSPDTKTDPFEEKTAGFAVDSEDNLYVNRGALQIAKLNSAAEVLIEAVNPEEDATAAAVDDQDRVFIDEGATVGLYASDGTPVERFGAGHLAASHGVAVDSSSETVYASNRETGTVTVFTTIPFTPTAVTGSASGLSVEGSATLNGTVNPEGIEVTACSFEYGPTSAYGSSAACVLLPGGGVAPVAVSADLSGLEPGRYHFRVTAANANGESHGADHSFIAGAHPTIFRPSVAAVAATSARFFASVETNGLATSYQLQYGPTIAYGSTTPLQSAGAGLGFTNIQIGIAGLAPATEYHARFVASNALGDAESPDIAFTTTAAPAGASSDCPNKTNSGFSPRLPDCRAYENVSAGGGPGEVYVPEPPNGVFHDPQDIITALPMRAAAGGGAVSYVGDAGSEGGTGNTGNGLGDQFLALRSEANGGWAAKNITPTIPLPEGGRTSEPVYVGFSPDLSLGILGSNSQSFAATSTPAGPRPCQVLYTRTGDGSFHALFTSTLTPGFCGKLANLDGGREQQMTFAGTNEGTLEVPADSHLLFQSQAALVAPAEPSSEASESGPRPNGTNLYETTGGAVRLVSMLPGGAPDANAAFGGPNFSSRFPTLPDFENVISADGRRVFWTDVATGRIYMRLDGTSTVPVSTGSAQYWSATPDGRYVFYTENGQLWRYDTTAAAREPLTGAGAEVLGVSGVSNDGSYVYFVAAGALGEGAEPRRCRKANDEAVEKREKGELTGEEAIQLDEEREAEDRGHLPPDRGCNLYLVHDGMTRLVTALGASDDEFPSRSGSSGGNFGDWQGELGSRFAQVADGGRELVFVSTQQLTGYDNSRLAETRGESENLFATEVFVFDSDSGKLACASCDPAGAAPSIAEAEKATNVPVSSNPSALSRWVSADGSRVFFNTSQPLVPQDTNNNQDVYEWEREGSTGCPVATSRWGGCVFLLSGGESADASFFVDASADGGDVFFTHRGSLAGVNKSNDKAELFDARVDGGFPESASACTGTGCQGVPPASPGYATPASATFSGTGNYPPGSGSGSKGSTSHPTRAQLLAKALKKCRHRHKPGHKRLACKRAARKRYAPPHTANKKPATGQHHKKGRP
jgi:hypothetical protein